MSVQIPPTTTLVAAVDPGKVTGLSYMVVSDEAWSKPSTHELTVPEFFDHFPRTFDMFDRPDGRQLIVVVEKFTISERTIKTALSLDALDIIGWLKGEQQYIREAPFHKLSPGQSKGFATDEKLKALDWFNPTKDGHANDANRLLLSWVMTTDWPLRKTITTILAKELLK